MTEPIKWREYSSLVIIPMANKTEKKLEKYSGMWCRRLLQETTVFI